MASSPARSITWLALMCCVAANPLRPARTPATQSSARMTRGSPPPKEVKSISTSSVKQER